MPRSSSQLDKPNGAPGNRAKPPFRRSAHFACKLSRWASAIALGLAAVLGVGAVVTAVQRVDHWYFLLLASGIAFGASLKLARGEDPSDKMPTLPRAPS